MKIIKRFILILVQLFTFVQVLGVVTYQQMIMSKAHKSTSPVLSILLIIYSLSELLALVGVVLGKRWGYLLSVLLFIASVIYLLSLIIGLAALFSSL